ncbi:type-F conjugative transfer system secretin TraK, partial [Klebsiella pneumoniae]
MKKINPLFISGCLLLVAPAMSATLSGTLEPTVVPLTNGGQANIAVSNTDPNLFTVPGDRITAINGTVAKLAMRQPFVLFKGLTFQKLCLPGAFRPG